MYNPNPNHRYEPLSQSLINLYRKLWLLWQTTTAISSTKTTYYPTVLVFVQKSHETSTNINTCVIFDPTAVIVLPNKRLISSAIWKFMACTSPRKTCNLATGMTRSWHDFGDRQNLLSDHECLSLEPHGEAWKLCSLYNSNTRLRHYQFSFGNIATFR